MSAVAVALGPAPLWLAADRLTRVTRALVGNDRSPGETAALDDAMDRYARGDDRAFGVVYDGIAPRLFAFALRRTRDRARAEDVVQQTLLHIHRARGSFAAGSEALPWAYAIARRALIDQHRRGPREVLSSDEDGLAQDLVASLDAPADDIAAAHELAARIQAELQKLPETQRMAFELIKQEGLSVREAAQALGTTVAAVKLRAHRAYEALRQALALPGRAP